MGASSEHVSVAVSCDVSGSITLSSPEIRVITSSVRLLVAAVGMLPKQSGKRLRSTNLFVNLCFATHTRNPTAE